MKIRLYLDTRASADGAAPLKVGISHHGATAYIPLGIYLLPSQFEQTRDGWRIVNHPERQWLSSIIHERVAIIERELLRSQLSGELVGMNIRQVRDHILQCTTPREQKRTLFTDYFATYNDTTHTARTHEIYSITLARIREFDSHADTLTFEDITPLWLERFTAFMRSRQHDPHNPNGTNIHLRNIRAVMNHAVHKARVTSNYPFDEFEFRNIETAKRSLSVDSLRALFNLDVDARMQRYIDFFKLMFFLRGANIIDVCNLRKADVINGRVEYVRRKTHVRYSVKIEPEAQAIIDKYEGKGEYLLNILDTNSNYLSFARNLTRRIKHAGEYVDEHGNLVMPFADISSYYMRHTFATIQINDTREDIYTVSKGLGHQYGSKVTAVYIDYDQRLADEANRRLIDWVLYGIKPER